jgi:hypothetical protein
MSKKKKPFKETKFAGVLGKVGKVLPEIAGAAYSMVVKGDFTGAIEHVADALNLRKDDPYINEMSLDFNSRMMEFELEFQRNDIVLHEIAAGDRASARKMATETSLWPQIILSMLYTTGYFGILYYYLTFDINLTTAQDKIVSGLMGTLSAAQLLILNFWFGSTAGSKLKTALMAKNK